MKKIYQVPQPINGWIGLDIGGANLKVCTLKSSYSTSLLEFNSAISLPFELWKRPQELSQTLREMLQPFDSQWGFAVTMTGELADCFISRQDGVQKIVDSVLHALSPHNSARSDLKRPASDEPEPLVRFYQLNSFNQGYFWADAVRAKQDWLATAAANWHAIAIFLGTCEELKHFRNGFLIDIGSTTTDIVPIRQGIPCNVGKTDLSRLQNGELVYAGIQRTPICSLVNQFRLNGKPTPIAREFFATIEDALLVTGAIPDNPSRFDTADGRSASRPDAMRRLAKMICADARVTASAQAFNPVKRPIEALDEPFVVSLAQQAISHLGNLIGSALSSVIKRNRDLPLHFFVSGQGSWFADCIIREQMSASNHRIQLSNVFGEKNSEIMAAYAVARLASRDFSTAETLRLDLIDVAESGILPLAAESEESDAPQPIRVVKLGGSLLLNPETPDRIRAWLSNQVPMHNLWIVGGGKMVDVIREFDETFELSQSDSHQLALAAMSLNLRLVQSWFPKWPIVTQVPAKRCSRVEQPSENLLLDFDSWLRLVQYNGGAESEHCSSAVPPLVESWDVTSDSCAAYLASVCQAAELVVLKSCKIGDVPDLQELMRRGVLDLEFPRYVQALTDVRIVNLCDTLLTQSEPDRQESLILPDILTNLRTL